MFVGIFHVCGCIHFSLCFHVPILDKGLLFFILLHFWVRIWTSQFLAHIVNKKFQQLWVYHLLLPSENYHPGVFRPILWCFHSLGRHQKSKANYKCGHTLCLTRTGFNCQCSEDFMYCSLCFLTSEKWVWIH